MAYTCDDCGVSLTMMEARRGRHCHRCDRERQRRAFVFMLVPTVVFALLAVYSSPIFWIFAVLFGIVAYTMYPR